MAIARYDLGGAVSLKTEALGEPGKRTFRLLVAAERGSATIWIEKQQLSALALSIRGALEELKGRRPRRPVGRPPAAALQPAFDFKAAALGLAYDEETGRIGILASNAEDAEARKTTLVCWAMQDQSTEMAEEALKAVAAGRPVCLLCHQPIDSQGHMCSRANGHGPVKDHL